jgi:hypothetical protein
MLLGDATLGNTTVGFPTTQTQPQNQTLGDSRLGNSTLGLTNSVPDFDEIIGKSRADGTQQQIVRSNGERIFILEAQGQID